MPLNFKLIEKCYQDATHVEAGDADFLVEEDGWNDYYYCVMYHLHATSRLTHSGNEYLGYIKIMKVGQEKYESNLLRHDLGKDVYFHALPEGFVSLTTSVDVYQSLFRLLSPEQRQEFVDSMRMILSPNSPYFNDVKDSECFKVAMLRDTSMDNYGLKKGLELMLNQSNYYNLQEQIIGILYNDAVDFVELKFSCLNDVKSEHIPNGMLAFIGKNGSGKSTAIYKLAKLLYASPDQRFRLKDAVGEIKPNDIGVGKLFVISYSPFDNFVLPGIVGEDYRLMLEGMENNLGRFVFCGIRDVKKEFEKLLQNPDENTYETLFERERMDETSLKSIGQLAVEFERAMNDLGREKEKEELWKEITEQAHELFPEIERIMKEVKTAWPFEPDQVFMSLSTGCKFFLHSLAHVLAYIEMDSLILFDEPENHIHPPMLSFMMAAMRRILNRYHSVMLVATHSPVVAQEIFADNVYVVRNDDGSKSISHPAIETYGANISEITSEVFSLTSDVTNYYDVYKNLYVQWKSEGWRSVDEMLDSFNRHLNGRISPQMMSYLINLYYVDSEEA